jgi:hypothetical protein
MNYTTFEETLKQAGLPVEGDALSVYRADSASDRWTAQTGSTLQRGVDPHADYPGQIGGDDDATGHSGMGALASRVATKGAARNTGKLSVRGDRKPTCYRRWIKLFHRDRAR